MYRFGRFVDGSWVAHSHQPLFEMGTRLVTGAPGSDPLVFQQLVACLKPPYQLLYVLHTARGAAVRGRYQSPPISLSQVEQFLARFQPFLSADGRFDLWAHSPEDDATVVWDRHDQVFGYGPLDRYAKVLRSLGFTPGRLEIPVPHEHRYHPALDSLAAEVLSAFDWSHSPLHPEDAQ